MNRSAAPGLGQWLTVSIIVIAVLFLLYNLFQYGNFRQNYPIGLTVAGVDVGGRTPADAEQILIDRYINAPIVIYHGDNRVEINPLQVEFALDTETMFSRADYEKDQQDYWAGFWGFLIGQPVEINNVELAATHDQAALLDVMQRVANSFDSPAQPAQPVPGSFSFQYGETGLETDLEASLPDVTAALYRPTDREAFLTVNQTLAERPEINLLARLLVNNTQEFEQTAGGVASVFILDLEGGDEITLNAGVAMSGMGLMKIPMALEAFRRIDGPITVAQEQVLAQALLNDDDEAANALLSFISGNDDPEEGALLVTQMLQSLGFSNSYIVAPFGTEDETVSAPETPANTVVGLRTQPRAASQTTAEELGTLLSMLYYCAEYDSGALLLAFPDDLSQEECQQIVAYLGQNEIDSLIEQGVPNTITVAHRHGWIEDTHADAGIVYSPNGAYVIVEMMYKPTWLEWEVSSPLMANISRATFNFFNFDEPFLDARSN